MFIYEVGLEYSYDEVINTADIFFFFLTDQIQLSKFLRRSLMIFIIKGFRTICFIFIVISTKFRPICPPAFFRFLSNSGAFTELRTTSFIESTGVTCSDSVSHNRVQVLSIFCIVTRLQSGLNLQPPDDYILSVLCIVEIAIKMKTIVRKSLMIMRFNH